MKVVEERALKEEATTSVKTQNNKGQDTAGKGRCGSSETAKVGRASPCRILQTVRRNLTSLEVQ